MDKLLALVFNVWLAGVFICAVRSYFGRGPSSCVRPFGKWTLVWPYTYAIKNPQLNREFARMKKEDDARRDSSGSKNGKK